MVTSLLNFEDEGCWGEGMDLGKSLDVWGHGMKGKRRKTDICLNREGHGILGLLALPITELREVKHVCRYIFFRHINTKQAFNHLNIYDKKARWLILPLTFHQAGTAAPLPQASGECLFSSHHASPALHNRTIIEGRDASLPSTQLCTLAFS